MTFITLDDKDWCKGVYTDGKLYFNKFPAHLNRTWKYSHLFDDDKTLFAHLWCEGKTIEQICPQSLKDEFDLYNKKLNAFHRSFIEAKINLNDNCFFDLVPEQFLLEYCDLKCKIVDSVFDNNQKPENYSFYVSLERLFYKIRNRQLNLDLNAQIKTDNFLKAKRFLSSLKQVDKSISYNQFGTKTARLSTNQKSFPILTMNSDYRSVVKPTNDLFVELDYNAAEARTLLSLAGKEQPKTDLHEWNAGKLGISRDEAKKGLFAWLYGSRKDEYKRFSELFDVNNVLDRYYNGENVTNPYGRKIESDQFHALNYLVQSTTSDLVLRQILKVDEYLLNSKSNIAFIIHDAVYLDITNADRETIRKIIDIFANNSFGVFPVNVSIGKDFGNLVKINQEDL